MTDTKYIFITGGASGIGREVAKYFAQRGWFVGLADVNMKGMDETAAMLPAGMAATYMLDVRSREQWTAALEAFTEASDGKLHVLFNNAGVGIGGLLEEHSEDDIEKLIDINFKGVVYGAHIGHRYLKATPGSCLLNTSSASGIYGSAGLSVYSATKFAVRGLSEALDIEWGPDNIRVRALLPSFIDTPLLDGPVARTNQSSRDSVTAAGLEIAPVAIVAEAAWAAVHDPRNVHSYVGPTAKKLAFAAKWMPGSIRKRGGIMARKRAES
ncbi:short-chain dehydrogenase [Blastomonas sp. AAP25]|jgi:NAD(P)-dependent dehydrogenase (short-subunit alcohol dehydrogenase family)|uniref:SDR family oxidoreductase n=1 Tax=Blastomonas sp. AAP25 TaxID=1523416 RepID=UPI0006B96086|nr:SDR family oxidoreductase [Blastomonas sp. AAP25]KPF75423.1 short-chain dehydrogenase [Blastomonas sp. AAP25]